MSIEECDAKPIPDRKNPMNIVFICSNGLVVLPRTPIPINSVFPNHRYHITFERKKSRNTGREYGILVNYEPIHEFKDEVDEEDKIEGEPPNYKLVAKKIYKKVCTKCGYMEKDERTDETPVDIIKINDKLYYVPKNIPKNIFDFPTEVPNNTETKLEPEVTYIELASVNSDCDFDDDDNNMNRMYVPLFDAKLPTTSAFTIPNFTTPINVISKEVFEKILQLEEKKKVAIDKMKTGAKNDELCEYVKNLVNDQKKIVINELEKKGFKIYRKKRNYEGFLFEGEYIIKAPSGETSRAIIDPELGLVYKGKYSLVASLLI